MRIPPLAIILSWPTPNYVDPATRGVALLSVNITFISLVIVAVVGRFYSRICIQRNLGLDDWTLVPAVAFSVSLTVVVVLADQQFGWDRHLWDIAPSMYMGANLMAFIAKLMFTMASMFTRLSLECFYYRLVKESGIRWFHWVLHFSVAWTAAVGVVFSLLTIWLCTPVRCYWVYPPMEHCQCLDEGQTIVVAGVANSLTDLLVTLLPIPIIMRLQISLKQRLGVSALLSLGGIVTVAGAVRTYYSWKGLIQSWDETWWTYPLWIAAAVEIDLAVMCSCAPAWKPLVQGLLPRIYDCLSSNINSTRSSRAKPASPISTPMFSSRLHQRGLNRDPYTSEVVCQCSRASDATDRGNRNLRNCNVSFASHRQRGAEPPCLSTEEPVDTSSRLPTRLHITMSLSVDQHSSYASSPRSW